MRLGFSEAPIAAAPVLSLEDMLPPRLNLYELLRSVRLRPAGGGYKRHFYKMWCPFHEKASGRTLWVAGSSGSWGCHSDRCPYHGGGPLWQLLSLRGMSETEARRVEMQVEFHGGEGGGGKPVGLECLEVTTDLREAHVQAWKVDWPLARAVYEAGLRVGGEGYAPGRPISEYTECPAQPGTVEHDCWEQLYHLHGHRGLALDALDLMDVGYDRRLGKLIFPIRAADGQVRGVARREPLDGKPYVLGGSIYVPEDGDSYQYRHVERGDVLWGWHEQLERIQAGEDVIVVEGYADQLRLLGYGYCAVAKMGRILTQQQVALLRTAPGRKIVWPDFDRPGLRDAPRDAAQAPGDFLFVTDGGGFKDAGSTGVTAEVAARAVASAVPAPLFVAQVADLFAAAA